MLFLVRTITFASELKYAYYNFCRRYKYAHYNFYRKYKYAHYNFFVKFLLAHCIESGYYDYNNNNRFDGM